MSVQKLLSFSNQTPYQHHHHLNCNVQDEQHQLKYQGTLEAFHHDLPDCIEFQMFPSENNLIKEIARVQKTCEYVVETNLCHDTPHMACPCCMNVHVYQEHISLHQIHKANLHCLHSNSVKDSFQI